MVKAAAAKYQDPAFCSFFLFLFSWLAALDSDTRQLATRPSRFPCSLPEAISSPACPSTSRSALQRRSGPVTSKSFGCLPLGSCTEYTTHRCLARTAPRSRHADGRRHSRHTDGSTAALLLQRAHRLCHDQRPPRGHLHRAAWPLCYFPLRPDVSPCRLPI